MRFLHTADWQLGCPFSQFKTEAHALRAQRLATLRHALTLAEADHLDAFIIAGDLFDDNQVAASLLHQVHAAFAAVPTLRILIVPGNHDPNTGPGSIWQREPFRSPPTNVTIVTQPTALQIGDGWVVANPLRQKLSTLDPSTPLRPLLDSLPPGTPRVGVTHGAIAIECKHQPNDHPIHPEAASRLGLDYLAVGHWHSWFTSDAGRLVMPGTPEPDGFDQPGAGFGARVTLPAPGAPPQVEQLPLAGLSWKSLELDFQHGDQARALAFEAVQRLKPAAPSTVLRITLRGAAPPGLANTLISELQNQLAPFLARQVVDRSQTALTAAELEGLSATHPLLGQVLVDLAQVRTFATGLVSPRPADTTPLNYAEYQALLTETAIDPALLTEDLFKRATDLLASALHSPTP